MDTCLSFCRYEISRALALAKARVIMVNRKEDQGDEAVSKIKKESNGEANIEWIDCDLGNLKQVKEVFDGIRKKEQQLDIVRLLTGLISRNRLTYSLSLSAMPVLALKSSTWTMTASSRNSASTGSATSWPSTAFTLSCARPLNCPCHFHLALSSSRPSYINSLPRLWNSSHSPRSMIPRSKRRNCMDAPSSL